MNRQNLHNYQLRAVDFIESNLKVGIFLFLGAGKSVISLTAVSDLLSASVIKKVLVVGPLRVVNGVWKQEKYKWDHLSHLRINLATGNAKERTAALKSNGDIWLINVENVPWLIKNFPFDYDAVILDESSRFKNPSALRFRALKKVINKSNVVVLLTGTPAAQGLTDLWSQIYLLDQGEALGKNITAFRKRFCNVDFWGHTWTIKEGYSEKIQNLIKPLVLSMEGSQYLELPERVDLIEKVVLPEEIQKQYESFEKNLFMEHDGEEIDAMSAAVLAGKLLQFTSGSIYFGDDHEWKEIHIMKLDALADIVEDNPSENLIVAYGFRHSLARIRKRFPEAVMLDKEGKVLEAWNRGEIKMLLIHPASAGHGINAQYGGSVLVWFDIPWSLELHFQACGRLWRQGQEKPVRIIHLVCENTIDERVVQVLNAKDKVQSDLLEALR